LTKLTHDATAPGVLPRLMPQTGGVQPGQVCVMEDDGTGKLTGQLENGEKAVLRTPGGIVLELTTTAETTGASGPGTYLDTSDFVSVGTDFANPTLRLYGAGDWFRKATTIAGLALLLSVAVSLATAGFGAWFVFAAKKAPGASSTAAKTQSLLDWATEPSARAVLNRRKLVADTCLEKLRGNADGPATVGGVTCSAPEPGFWRNKDNAAWFATILGIVAALLAARTSMKQLSFGKQPA
jgi:hypothetical protein